LTTQTNRYSDYPPLAATEQHCAELGWRLASRLPVARVIARFVTITGKKIYEGGLPTVLALECLD